MAEFKYQEPFPIQKDSTEYRLLTKDYVKTIEVEGRKILKIQKEGLELLAREAYADVSFYLRASHLQKLANILKDPEASDNDKFVAHTMLMNQVVSAEGELPTCQDTGTAIAIGKKGENVWTDGNDAEAISKGVFETYRDRNLRYSQVVPYTMFDEKNSGTNLPAQIDLYATQGNKYEFLFITKGGGSANKTFLYQQTKHLSVHARSHMPASKPCWMKASPCRNTLRIIRFTMQDRLKPRKEWPPEVSDLPRQDVWTPMLTFSKITVVL